MTPLARQPALRRRDLAIPAVFLAAAMVLGGGGSPNPLTEILLQALFVVCAGLWIWTVRGQPRATPGVLILSALVLAIPVAQLVPLPPAVWQALPGREPAIRALALVGAEAQWRPLTLVPSRTIAAIAAIVPALFVLWCVAALPLAQRRQLALLVAGLAGVSALLGALQMAAGSAGLNLYPDFHAGVVTGFFANRNATADGLLVGLLCLAAGVGPALAVQTSRTLFGMRKSSLATVAAALAILLLLATVLTASRAGIALICVALGLSWLILRVEGAVGPAMTRWRAAGMAMAIASLALAAVALSPATSPVGQVVSRFTGEQDNRTYVWEDAWYAAQTYWPAGIGVGGFETAILPAERLEVLDATRPNRAHNDFLEWLVEAGLPGQLALAAVALVLAVLAVRGWKDTTRRGSIVLGAGILFLIALHSIVDYPLRNMAMACLAGFGGGLLAAGPPRVQSTGIQQDRAAKSA